MFVKQGTHATANAVKKGKKTGQKIGKLAIATIVVFRAKDFVAAIRRLSCPGFFSNNRLNGKEPARGL